MRDERSEGRRILIRYLICLLAGILIGLSLAHRVDAAPLRHGVASWYDDGPGLYGAVHSWRFGDRPYRLTVSSAGRSVVVTIRDYCACPGNRIIDLSPSAFSKLALLSRGLIYVDIGEIGPNPTLPPTDI